MCVVNFIRKKCRLCLGRESFIHFWSLAPKVKAPFCAFVLHDDTIEINMIKFDAGEAGYFSLNIMYLYIYILNNPYVLLDIKY